MNSWEVVSYRNLYGSPALYSPANREIHLLGHQHPTVVPETSLVENGALFLLEDKQGLTQMVVHNDHNLLDPDEI
jgi:hypothetical protein